MAQSMLNIFLHITSALALPVGLPYLARVVFVTHSGREGSKAVGRDHPAERPYATAAAAAASLPSLPPSLSLPSILNVRLSPSLSLFSVFAITVS